MTKYIVIRDPNYFWKEGSASKITLSTIYATLFSPGFHLTYLDVHSQPTALFSRDFLYLKKKLLGPFTHRVWKLAVCLKC